MDLYIATKTVLAKPMSFEAYNKKRGWDLPDIDKRAEEGFLVEDLDSEDPNQKAHAGHISWLPKDVFNRLFQNVETGMSFGSALVFLESGHKVAMKSTPNVIYEFVDRDIVMTNGSKKIVLDWILASMINAKDWVLVK